MLHTILKDLDYLKVLDELIAKEYSFSELLDQTKLSKPKLQTVLREFQNLGLVYKQYSKESKEKKIALSMIIDSVNLKDILTDSPLGSFFKTTSEIYVYDTVYGYDGYNLFNNTIGTIWERTNNFLLENRRGLLKRSELLSLLDSLEEKEIIKRTIKYGEVLGQAELIGITISVSESENRKRISELDTLLTQLHLAKMRREEQKRNTPLVDFYSSEDAGRCYQQFYQPIQLLTNKIWSLYGWHAMKNLIKKDNSLGKLVNTESLDGSIGFDNAIKLFIQKSKGRRPTYYLDIDTSDLHEGLDVKLYVDRRELTYLGGEKVIVDVQTIDGRRRTVCTSYVSFHPTKFPVETRTKIQRECVEKLRIFENKLNQEN